MLNGFKSVVQYPCVALQKRRLCRQQLKVVLQIIHLLDFFTLKDGIPGFFHTSNGMYCHERVNVSQIKECTIYICLFQFVFYIVKM